MHQISIPDPLYREVQRVAQASGMSVERFVREAVRIHLEDDASEQETLVLTDEQMAQVLQAQAEVRAGKFFTVEETWARLAESRKEWLATHQGLSPVQE